MDEVRGEARFPRPGDVVEGPPRVTGAGDGGEEYVLARLGVEWLNEAFGELGELLRGGGHLEDGYPCRDGIQQDPEDGWIAPAVFHEELVPVRHTTGPCDLGDRARAQAFEV